MSGSTEDEADDVATVEEPEEISQAREQVIVESSNSSESESDLSEIYADSASEDWGEDDSFLVDSDDDYDWSDDDYFMNELELPDTQEMENFENDGGYDDDTDADDDVIILDDPGEDGVGEEGVGGGGDDEGDGDNEDQETENEADADDEERDRIEGQEPPRKVARMEPNQDSAQGTSAASTSAAAAASTSAAAAASAVEDADNDGFTCTICYDQFTNSGEHRISCLKCGHVFGKNCIEKWLKIHGRCPQCNCKAKKGEVRVLYVKSLQAVDNTELTEAKKELEKFQATISKCNLDNTKQRITIDSLSIQLKNLEQQVTQLKQISSRNAAPCSCNNPGPSSSATALYGVGPGSLPGSQKQNVTPDHPTGRKQLKYSLAKSIEIKEGICRVGAYNEWLNLMVVSHDMKNSLFPNGCCGIKQINMMEQRPTVSMPLHQKQIRDMQFSLCQNDVILTVSMDKKAMLYNCAGNVTVQSFQTDYPLWSCVWDEVQTHIFYVGCSNGSVIAYDIRSPQDPLAAYPQGPDTSPVCRLKYVTPAYQTNAFNLSGLLVQKLTSVSFGEFRERNNSEMRFHQLPMEGPFLNVDFEKVSRHLLVSTRPSPRNDATHGSHFLGDLTQYYSETLERNVVTSNVIHTYQGSNRDGKMSRASLFSPEEGYVYVMANGTQNTVKYWDTALSETNHKSIANAPDYVLDCVHGTVNSNHFLGLISEKGVRIFNQTLDY